MFLFKRFHLSGARRIGLVLCAGIILLSSVVTTLLPSNAFANLGAGTVTAGSGMSADDEAKSYTYLLALKYCVRDHMKGDIPVADLNAQRNADPSAWFDGYDGSSGYVYPDGKKECKDIASAALPLWGWKDNQSFLSDIGYAFDSSNLSALKWHGTADGNTRVQNFLNAAMPKVYGLNNTNRDPPVSDPAYYAMYINAFNTSPCSAQDKGIYPTSNPDLNTAAEQSKTESGANPSISGMAATTGTLQYRRIDIVNPSTKLLETHVYAFTVSTDTTISSDVSSTTFSNPTTAIIGGGPSQDKQFTKTCSQVGDELSRLAPIIVKYLALNKAVAVPGAAGHLFNCATGSSCAPPAGGSSCNVDGIGWIICPISNSIAKGVDAIFGMVKTFLEFHTYTTDTSSGLYTAWSAMRNLANIIFVIAFLIIIFSQLSSVGINNYGIKKMLPRLVIAAVLVNLSYWICGIAVDLSNIIGASLGSLMDGVKNSIHGNPVNTNWADAIGTVLAGAGVGVFAAGVALSTVASVGALLWLAVPIVLSAIVAVVIAFLILAARQVLIIILIAVSPLAFVAYLLPNTSKWFDKWKDAFVTLLVMYPIIALVFGGAQLAAGIILASGTKDHPISMVQVLFALAVQVIPLAITPIVVKFSGGVLGKFAGIVNNRNRGPLDAVKNYSKEKADLATKGAIANGSSPFNRMGQRRDFRKRADAIKGKRYESRAEANWQERITQDTDLSGINNELMAESSRGAEAQKKQKKEYLDALTDSPELLKTAAGVGGDSAAAKIEAAIKAEEIAETKKAIENIKVVAEFAPGSQGIKDMGLAMAQALESGDTNRARAMQDMLLTSGQAGINQWRETMKSAGGQQGADGKDTATMTEMRRDLLSVHSGLKASAIDVNTFGVKGGSLEAIQQDASTYKMSDEELVHQKESTVNLAIAANGISKEQAMRIVTNEDLAKSLGSDELRSKITEIATRP